MIRKLLLVLLLLSVVVSAQPSDESIELFKRLQGEQPNVTENETAEPVQQQPQAAMQISLIIVLLIIVAWLMKLLIDKAQENHPGFEDQVSKARYYLQMHKDQYEHAHLVKALRERGYSSRAIKKAFKELE